MNDCNPELFRHPGERAARARLEKIPGFGKFMDMMTTNFNAAAERQAELGSMARVGPGVYPALHELWGKVREKFGLAAVPLHIAATGAAGMAAAQHPVALRGGNERPAVVLDASLLSSLPEREMEALLAMQAGSIRLGNATLISASDMMRWFLDYYGIVGAPAVLPAWGLENWRRFALFSADRAAALATGGPEAVSALLRRVAGAAGNAWGGVPDPGELRVQGLEALSLQNDPATGKFMRRLALAMHRGNSIGIVRLVDLADWFATGIPARILSGEITDPDQAEVKPDAEPSAAYWGEFAACRDGEEEDEKSAGVFGGIGGVATEAASQAFDGLKDSAEKGLGALFRAGEAFWTTLTENNKPK